MSDENASGADAGTEEQGVVENQDAGTIASGNDGGETQSAPQTWPDDWRQRMASEYAGADNGEAFEKELKILERMSSPFDAYKGKREQDKKISSGELKDAPTEFPTEGTDDEKAKWRADNGIPADPKGYEEHLDGLVMGDDAKPLLDAYLNDAHASNIPPQYVKGAVDWYLKQEELRAKQQNAEDVEFHDKSVTELKAEFGGEYQRTMADLNTYLDNFGEGVKDNLLGARLANGTLLGDSPAVLKGIISQMRQINPLSTVVPGGGADGIQSVEHEIAEIQRLIATDPQKYWGDKAKQDRFLQLVEARDGYKQRQAG